MIFDLINSGADPSKIVGLWLLGALFGFAIGRLTKKGD